MKKNLNNRYQIETRNGFKPFEGLKKVSSNYNYILKLSNNNYIHGTANHQIIVGKNAGGRIARRLYKLKTGDKVGKGIKIVSIEVLEDSDSFYDFINVNGDNTYLTANGIEHHNCDEMAWIEEKKIKGFLDSAMPALSSGKDTKILFISTANGYNTFYNYASNGDAITETDIKTNKTNGFKYMEYDYTCVPGRDEAWFNQKVQEEGILQANRNYRVKFLGSGDTLIKTEFLIKLRNAVQEPLDTYDEAHHDFNIYEYPMVEEHIIYTVGVDSSKISVTSAKKSDEMSIQVIKIDLRERKLSQVATLVTKDMHYTEVAEVIQKIGTYYLNAWALIENNSEGQAIANDLFDIYEYENVYTTAKRNDIFGFRTTTTTRSIGISNLKKLIHTGVLDLVDIKTINDLFTFVRNTKGKYEAQGENDHDDSIFAIIAALYWLQDNMNEMDITLRDFIDKTVELPLLTISENTGDSEDEDVSGMFFSSGV